MATLDDVLGALALVQQELIASRAETAALKERVERMQRNPFDVPSGRFSAPEQMGAERALPAISVTMPMPIPLAAPERYAGDPAKVQVFLTQIMLHFSCRANVFPSDQAKVAFMISYLVGDAALWAVPLVRNNDPLLTNWDNFQTEFEKVFDRRTATLSADRELLDLRQGKKDLVSYLTSFNRLIAETSWPEEKRAALFYQGLKEELKDVLAQIDPQPTSCVELINLTLRLDHRLTERGMDKRKGERGFPRNERQREVGVPVETGTEPMEVGSVHSPLSKEERDLRRRNGLCLYCGKKGHFIRECTSKPRTRTSVFSAKRVAAMIEEGSEN